MGFEAVGGAYFVAEFDEFGDFDGDDCAGVGVDEEGVAGLSDGELVVGLFAVEEDMLDDACGFEEFECAVDGGFGDGVALGFEGVEELVGLEEGFEGDDGVEDLGAFGGVFEPFCFECASEDGAEGFDEFGLGGLFVCWFDGLEGHGRFYGPGWSRCAYNQGLWALVLDHRLSGGV